MYGSWYDPSNPVVRPPRSIRQDLWERLCLSASKADLCLVIGTSLRWVEVGLVTLMTCNSVVSNLTGWWKSVQRPAVAWASS